MLRRRWSVSFFLALVLLSLLLVTGCDLIDQLIGGGVPGGGDTSAVKAVITAEVDKKWVDTTLNPDLRPPLMYRFSAANSLDQYGNPIHKPYYEVAWDFGDGETAGFEYGGYVISHRYWEEGKYTVTLTVRENSAYGNASDTVQKQITIGPGWLEIISVTTAPRLDGKFDFAVTVRNQSRQTLQSIAVDLLADGVPFLRDYSVDLTDKTPDRLAPGETYIIKGIIQGWTGKLSARSSWCYPIAN